MPGASDEELTPIEELRSTSATYREALIQLRKASTADYIYVVLIILLAITDLSILHIPPQLIISYILRIPTVLPHIVIAMGPAMTYVFMFWTFSAFALYIFYRDRILPDIWYFIDGVITGFSSLIAYLYTGIITLLVFTGFSMYELAVLYTSRQRWRDELKDAIYDAYQYGVRTPYTEEELRLIGFSDEELTDLLGIRKTQEPEKTSEEGEEGGEEG